MQGNGFVGERAYEIGLPVPLQARRIETIEQTLQHWMRNRADHVKRGSLEAPDRLEHLLRPPERSCVAPHYSAHLLVVQMLREGRPWRDGVESKEPIDVIGRLRNEAAVPAHHLRRVFHPPQHRPAVTGVHMLRLEQK